MFKDDFELRAGKRVEVYLYKSIAKSPGENLATRVQPRRVLGGKNAEMRVCLDHFLGLSDEEFPVFIKYLIKESITSDTSITSESRHYKIQHHASVFSDEPEGMGLLVGGGTWGHTHLVFLVRNLLPIYGHNYSIAGEGGDSEIILTLQGRT